MSLIVYIYDDTATFVILQEIFFLKLHLILLFAILFSIWRIWYNGITRPSQGCYAGPTPVIRSYLDQYIKCLIK